MPLTVKELSSVLDPRARRNFKNKGQVLLATVASWPLTTKLYIENRPCTWPNQHISATVTLDEFRWQPKFTPGHGLVIR